MCWLASFLLTTPLVLVLRKKWSPFAPSLTLGVGKISILILICIGSESRISLEIIFLEMVEESTLLFICSSSQTTRGTMWVQIYLADRLLEI